MISVEEDWKNCYNCKWKETNKYKCDTCDSYSNWKSKCQREFSFPLAFESNLIDPTEEGNYILLNKCDGYHIVEWINENIEMDMQAGFYSFAGNSIYWSKDSYDYWAKLPDSWDVGD